MLMMCIVILPCPFGTSFIIVLCQFTCSAPQLAAIILCMSGNVCTTSLKCTIAISCWSKALNATIMATISFGSGCVLQFDSEHVSMPVCLSLLMVLCHWDCLQGVGHHCLLSTAHMSVFAAFQ